MTQVRSAEVRQRHLDKLGSYEAAHKEVMQASSIADIDTATIERTTRISPRAHGNGSSAASRLQTMPNASAPVWADP
jgi:hypothetical protein